MIVQTLANSDPYIIYSGTATKTASDNVPNIPLPSVSDITVDECEYTEMVFAEVGGEWWKNDKNRFLYQKAIAADTISIGIYKDDVLLTTITDDTYGTYYSTFTAKPLYVCFIVFWENVYNVYGAGWYEIKADKVIIGVASTESSHLFRLLPYSSYQADGTTRIESYQTGNIIRSQFDYTDLVTGGLYQSFRINGKLSAPRPKINIDRNRDENDELIQIQESVTNEWDLETKQIPACVSNMINYDNVLANIFLVTDYNIYNHEIYRRKELYITAIEKVNEPSQNKERSYKLTLADTFDDIIKRNW